MKLCPNCQHCYEDTDIVCPEDNSSLAAARAGSLLLAGKYRLEQLLGSGDIGTAYAATETGSGRHVIAVELLREDVLSDPQALERFHSAAQAAGGNNDQEVGQILEHGPLQGGGAYVAMELLDSDDEQEKADTQSTNIALGTPTVEMKRPTLSTGWIDARRARAPKLASIARELTQEVPRIPLPLPPRETPVREASTGASVPKAEGGNEREAGSSTQPIASHGATTVEAREQPPAHISDIPRSAETRHRPFPLYLGLALLLLALVLTAVWYGLRSAPNASPDRSAAQTGMSAQGSTATQSQQTGTDANIERTSPAPAAQSPATESTENAGAATNASDGRSQAADPRAAVSGVLDDWLSAFVKQDAEKFMSFYMPELDAFYDRRNVRLSALRPDIVRFFQRTERMEARMIGEPRINFTDGDRVANVRFRLSYSIEDKGRDRQRGDGTQELRMVKTERGWKIESHRGEKLMG
jgi:hypothetical protein